MKEALVISTTTNKLLNKAKVYGVLDLKTVAFLSILDYYIKFLESQPQYDKNVTNLLALREKFSYISNKCNDVCNYRVALSLLCQDETSKIEATNTPPTVSGVTVDYPDAPYVFKYSDFTNNFNDVDLGDRPDKVRIDSLPDVGTLIYNGSPITTPFTFSLTQVGQLSFDMGTNSSGLFGTSFIFRTSDNHAAYSAPVTFTFDLTDSTINMPATIGDNSIEVANNVTTVLTLEMFTSQTTPPYNDPESDLIDAIRVDKIHSTNQGKFYVNGVEIVVEQIITREQLAAGEFTHIGADINTIATDSFDFSARDEGSGIWVQ